MRAFGTSWLFNFDQDAKPVWLWALAIVSGAALALTEGNAAAKLAAAGVLPLFPGTLPPIARLALLATTALLLFFGEQALLLGVPLGFAIVGLQFLAATSAVALTCAAFGSHHLQSMGFVLSGEVLHSGSYAFIWVPVLAASIAAGVGIGWRSQGLLVGGGLLLSISAYAGRGSWMTVEVFTSPAFRTAVAICPAVVASLTVRCTQHRARPKLSVALAACLMAAAFVQFVPASPITSVVFDEAHGRWETVLAPFGPNDFGRSATYTYTLLRRYAHRLVGNTSVLMDEAESLPATSSLLMLKMPTKPIGEEFANRLEPWVRNGGRLVIVGDHTDLYDTTQNLNQFIARFNARINADAVFDARGMPNTPRTPTAAAVLGRIDATGIPISWQTGASLGRMPLHSVELATFGMSFSEPGDYSRPNRFGPFHPQLALRYCRHTAIAAFGVGTGAIAIVLDSTPWSTFSLFKREYVDLFRGLIQALSAPILLGIWGWGVVALGVTGCVLFFTGHPLVVVGSAVVLGITAGAAGRVGISAQTAPAEKREFNLRVVAGDSAKFEFLPQLVLPGERNYSRIVSSTFKYDLLPLATKPGSEVPELRAATQWLLIEPDHWQLPTREDVIQHLTKGGSLTILFAPDQAANVEIREWIGTLGLVTMNATALAAAEDARPGKAGFLERRGPVLLRDTRVVTAPLSHSLFNTREADQFIQSYTIRPSQIPRKSGLLNLGFSADQFSDAAVGDVWEGIHPSAIGRLRERQLAAVLLGKGLTAPFPDNLVMPKYDEHDLLNSYILFVDGSMLISGQFSNAPRASASQAIPAPIDDPVGYLLELKGRAVHFVRFSCPRSATKTECKARMMGPDMTEWMVAWVSDAEANIVAIELLHERRFSGLGRTLNVLFGQ